MTETSAHTGLMITEECFLMVGSCVVPFDLFIYSAIFPLPIALHTFGNAQLSTRTVLRIARVRQFLVMYCN